MVTNSSSRPLHLAFIKLRTTHNGATFVQHYLSNSKTIMTGESRLFNNYNGMVFIGSPWIDLSDVVLSFRDSDDTLFGIQSSTNEYLKSMGCSFYVKVIEEHRFRNALIIDRNCLCIPGLLQRSQDTFLLKVIFTDRDNESI